MPSRLRAFLERHNVTRWSIAWWVARHCPPPVRRWLWPKIARPSAFATRYLDGLKGIEIGASAHNDFRLDTINVDRYGAEEDTVFKEEQRAITGFTNARETDGLVVARAASEARSEGTGESRSGRARSSATSAASSRARRSSARLRGREVDIRSTVRGATRWSRSV